MGHGEQRPTDAAGAYLQQPVGGIVDRELRDRRAPLLAIVEGVVAESDAEGGRC
jgi:hypothetical protein